MPPTWIGSAGISGELVDPTGCARRAEAELDRGERVAHQRRFLSVTDDGAGGIRIRGRGSVEDGATLRAALLPLTAPTPSVDAETGEQLADHRDHGTRMFDAMVGLAQHSLDTRLAPASHGARPRVAVAIHLDDLQGRLRSGSGRRGQDSSHGDRRGPLGGDDEATGV